MSEGERLLQVTGLRVQYGGLHAVEGVDLAVDRGECVVILGANGAGKTSLLKSVVGLVTPAAGRIEYQGVDLGHHRPEQRVELGVVLVPEGRHIFTELTVDENLALARAVRGGDDFEFRLKKTLDMFPLLESRRHNLGGTLSGGEQQMLAIARALLTQPQLLMLDEPSTGLAPKLVRQVYEVLQVIRERGATLLIVEQNVTALEVASRVHVMRNGRIVDSGLPQEFRRRERLAAAYLGAQG